MGLDFNQFLYTSPNQEVRDKYEDLLIETYHNSMTETLKLANYTTKIPTLETIKTEIQNFKFFGKSNLIIGIRKRSEI